ncbi:MAG TPA: glycine cleavage system protein GcvH [Chloroflexi bacterium]|jgi:glycine cleavage system H protein|nr:glycine cleavage system protein GcvH [Chloroflexota bacterium]
MEDTYPSDLRYTESDEWVRQEGDELVSGISAFAAEQLGDVVYVQLPDVGAHYEKGAAFGEIESVKAVSDLNMPLAGEVVQVNEELDQNPGLINEDPYGRGWIVRFTPEAPAQYESLLDAQAYERSTTERH